MKRLQSVDHILRSTCRALSGSGVSRLVAAGTVATILALAGGAHAVSNQETCYDRISGSLSATPSVLDRETQSDLHTALTWSVFVEPGCPVSLRLSLAGRTLQGRSGELRVEVTETTTFELYMLLLPGARVLGTATVTVLAHPGFITVSNGRQITADDIAKFNGRWMQPLESNRTEANAEWWLKTRYDAGAWETSERMVALARMYELTRDDERYLLPLQKLLDWALEFRDDRHPGYYARNPETHEVFDFPANPKDEIRNLRGLPAWGGMSPNSGGLHRVDEVVSSLYAHAMATFARIVAEDPVLHTAHGRKAIDYANAVLQTVLLFAPQIYYRSVGNFVEAWLTLPPEYQHRPTEVECRYAHDAAVAGDPQDQSRWDQMLRNCLNLRLEAGTPVAHNINLAFAMVLIELSRVLGSPFYRLSEFASPDAEPARTFIPLLVSRQQRYFVNRLHPWNFYAVSCLFHFTLCWNFSDDLPPGINYHAEDTSHGALDMRYLDLLRRDVDRLNPLPASVGEPIPLDDLLLKGFADTFLGKIAVGTHLKENVIGSTANPVDNRNGNCDGWMNLAVADVNVYHRCREISLRIVNGKQPYLNIGNHSALLMNKRFLPVPPPPPPPSPPPPRMCPTGRKCCETAPDGGCALCIPSKAQCP